MYWQTPVGQYWTNISYMFAKIAHRNYTPQATHHAKFDFDPTTWVACANSQFTTVCHVRHPSLLPSIQILYFPIGK